MIFLKMLVYPLVWSLIVTTMFLFNFGSIKAGNSKSTNLSEDLLLFTMFFLLPSAPVMGIIGALHALALHFMVESKVQNLVVASVKIGCGIGLSLIMFFALPNHKVPNTISRIETFGLPAIITAALSGYILGRLSSLRLK